MRVGEKKKKWTKELVEFYLPINGGKRGLKGVTLSQHKILHSF